MSRYKTLANNALVFTISNFSSKILVFFMLPVYTSVLSREEYGTADLLSTSIGLLSSVLTLSIANASMRFALDSSKNVKQVFSIGLKFIIAGIGLLFVSLPLLFYIPIIGSFIFIFFLLYTSNVLQNYLNLFSRGVQKVRLVGITGIVSTLVVVISNIIMLCVFNMGIKGYIMSIILSNFVSVVILALGLKIWIYYTNDWDKALTKEMLTYSIPLSSNQLSWWCNHSANRYIISIFCSIGEVGIYSVASKMPMIIDTFRGIFIQAWQLSTINEYDKKDSSIFFSLIYQYYFISMILVSSMLIVFSKVIGSILYSSNFFEAWLLTPIMIYGMFWGSLIAFYSPIYLAIKKTKILFTSTLYGALITIIFNLVLIPYIGIMGAAVSSVLSNLIIFLYLHIDSKKYKRFTISNKNYYICSIILGIQATCVTLEVSRPIGIISLICLLLILFILQKDLLNLIKILKTYIFKKK